MASRQPVQVQRVGLTFAKHYAIRLPLALLYVVFISLPLMRGADPVRGGVLFWFGLGAAFLVVWFMFGGRYSLFANPFYERAQVLEAARRSLRDFGGRGGRLADENDPDLIVIKADSWDANGYPVHNDLRAARQQAARLRAEGKSAVTEHDLHRAPNRERGGLVWKMATAFLFGKVPYWLVKNAHYIGGALLVLVVAFNVHLVGSLLLAVLAFGVPFAILLFRPIKLILSHVIEEHPAFVNFFRLGIGGPSGRFAGIREFAQADMSEYFNRVLDEPPQSETSDIYLGRTPFFEDVRLFGRDVGLKGKDTHMITVARIGSGKSRDAIWNTVLNYSGGIICFDPKGEHYRISGSRRAKNNPVFVLDPYGSVKDLKETDFWNPLDEIDVDSVAARDQLENIAASSISMDKADRDPHFQETALRIFRGLIAHVLTKYEPKDRHLGTVYDLLVTGEPEGKYYNPKAFTRLVAEMAMNTALAGSAVEAANTLSEVGDRERGSILSTMARGLNWINSPAIRAVISKPSTFSLRAAKRDEASIFLVLPDDFISQQSRFLRTFFGLAGEVCGDYITPQPEGSKRRVLMIFDEFSALGHFKPAEEIVLRKRSAGIKCWFLLQNLSQLKEHYSNVENFITSSDKQFFGIDQADTYAMEILVNALGQYTEGEGRPGHPLPFERTREVFTNSDVAQWTNNASNGQIVIPAQGKPMKLKRVPFYENFAKSQYGKQKTSA